MIDFPLKLTLIVSSLFSLIVHSTSDSMNQGINLNDEEFDIKSWGEKYLIQQLLKDYDKRSRPVVDNLTPTHTSKNISISQITVEFGLALIQILDLDEMEQVLTTSVRSLYKWTDYHLIWDPQEFFNITEVNIPTSQIWLPDIALYNYADERLEERRECDARIRYNGTVEWHPMAIYKSTCPVKIKFFPFDKQICYLKFGPWTYDGFRVNISLYENRADIDMNDYVASPEWKCLGSLAKFYEFKYPCCPEPYPDIKFYIWIERQPAFYNYILILPCFLLSSLTLVLFWLPPETPAKMVLGMNIFVAFFLLLLLLEDSTPSASNFFPLIGTYYCLNMGLITLSTFLCLIIVNFHFRGDNRREVPYWLKKLAIHHGARILFVNVGIKKEKSEPVEVPLKVSNHSGIMRSSGTDLTTSLPPGIIPTFDNNIASYSMPLQRSIASRGDMTGFIDERLSSTVGAVTMPKYAPQQPPGYLKLHPQQPHYVAQEMASQSYLESGGLYPIGAAGNYPIYGSGIIGSHPGVPLAPVDGRKRQLMVVQDLDSSGSRTKPIGTNDTEEAFSDANSSKQRTNSSKSKRQSARQAASSLQNLPFRFEDNSDPMDPQTARRVNMITKDINDIVKGLRYLQKKNDTKEKVSKIVNEWRAVGMVLDRLFFVLYVFIIILTIIQFFPKSGNEVKVFDTEYVDE